MIFCTSFRNRHKKQQALLASTKAEREALLMSKIQSDLNDQSSVVLKVGSRFMVSQIQRGFNFPSKRKLSRNSSLRETLRFLLSKCISPFRTKPRLQKRYPKVARISDRSCWTRSTYSECRMRTARAHSHCRIVPWAFHENSLNEIQISTLKSFLTLWNISPQPP